MKIVKLYYKRDEARELNRLYIRKVSDSRTIGIAICHNEVQYKYLKNDIEAAWKIAIDNRGSQHSEFISDKLSIIAMSMTATTHDSNIMALDTIHQYLRDNPSRISDIIRAFSKWWMQPMAIMDSLTAEDGSNREAVETLDGYNTIFYIRAGSCEYVGGDCIDGELISYQLYDNSLCCEDCDHTEYGEDSEGMIYIDSRDYSVCNSCYDDNYTSCYDCGDAGHYDYMTYSESRDRYYCENCYHEQSGNSRIHSYDYSPEITFYDYKGDKLVRIDNPKDINLPFYGAELEVECLGGSKGELADNIANYGGHYEKFTYCKNDGSLTDGFEVCFMPMTFHAIKNFKFYDAVLKYRGRDRLQSFNTSTCGMHIHINREAFTDHHLFKFISFVHEFKSLIYLVSQRKKVGELNSFARFNNGWKDRAKKEMVSTIKHKKQQLADYDGTNIKKDIKLHSTAFYGEKYVPINLQHPNTIEVRIFKGNLLEQSFRKNFEFVDALYYFSRENPIYKLKAKEFVNYCTGDKKRYPNLNLFLASNTDRLQDILRFPLSVPEGLNY